MTTDTIDALYNPDEFLIVGPLWFLVRRTAVGPDGGYPVSAVLREVGFDFPVSALVPVFTELDLASVYLLATGEEPDEYQPFHMRDLAKLVGTLAKLERAGVTHVAIDADGAGRGVRAHAIGDVIEGTRAAVR